MMMMLYKPAQLDQLDQTTKKPPFYRCFLLVQLWAGWASWSSWSSWASWAVWSSRNRQEFFGRGNPAKPGIFPIPLVSTPYPTAPTGPTHP
jgi:hypothetical protein